MHNVKLKNTESGVSLFQSKRSIIFSFYLLICGCFIIGFLFFYLGFQPNIFPFKFFGIVFISSGFAIFYSYFTFCKKANHDEGYLLLGISPNEIILSHQIGIVPIRYTWDQIEKIIFTDILFVNGYDGIEKRKKHLIFLFRSSLIIHDLFAETNNSYNFTKEGAAYSSVPFPGNLTALQFRHEIESCIPNYILIEVQESISL